VAQTYVGSEIVEGDIVLAMVYEGFENLLLHALGEVNNVSASTSGTFTRDMDLSDTGRYQNTNSPSLSVHISRGIVGSGVTDPTVFTYEGCVVDGFTLSTTRDGPLLFTLSFFGQTETIATSSVTPSYPTAPVANGTECVSWWGSTALPFTDFTLTVRRNIDRERFFLGSTQTFEPPMGQYTCECSCTTEWDNEIRAGSSTLRADFRARTNRQLRFNFTSTDLIASTVAQYYGFDLKMPAALITQFPPNVSGQGRVTVPCTFTAFDDDTSSLPHEVRISQTTDSTFTE